MSWDAPRQFGDAPIDSYEYRWRAQGGGWTTGTNGPALPVEIGPVANGAHYEAQVRAVNAAGAGGWSASAEEGVYIGTAAKVVVAVVDQAEPPERVRNLRLTLGNPEYEEFNARWQRPANLGYPAVTGYEYRYRVGQSQWIVRKTAHGLPSTTVDELQAETTYTFQVRAINADGPGEWSETKTITTAEAPYEPVIASNQERWIAGAIYNSTRDPFSGGIRTDVRLFGQREELVLDVVCFDNGSTAVGFRLFDLEHDTEFPSQLEVIWRIDNGRVETRTLDVEPLGTTPSLYIQDFERGPEFESIASGSSSNRFLYVRIGYRGVHEDSFDLRELRSSPVHQNLVRCRDY